MRSALFLLCCLALMLSPLGQEGAGSKQEWTAFRSVLNILNDRDYDRARPELESFRTSAVPAIAARAHLEIGLIYLDQKRDPVRALPYLTEIVSNPKMLPLSSLWATAQYRIGQIKLAKAAAREQFLEAQRDFDRVYQTYPDAGVSSEALFMSALLSERLLDYDNAIAKYQRIRTEYTNSRSTPQALFSLARHQLFKGDAKAALLQLQEIRALFPDGADAKRALVSLTDLYRYYRATLGANRNLYGAPQEISISDVKELVDPHSLLIADNDDLFLIDRQKKYAFKFRPNGQVAQTLSILEPAAMAIGPDGTLYAAERDTVRPMFVKDAPVWRLGTPGAKAGTFRRINSLAVNSTGDLFAVDSESHSVIKYSTTHGRGAAFPPQQGLRAVKEVAIDGLDNVYLLDDKENRILIYSPLGDSIGQIRIPSAAGRSGGGVYLATDTLNHLYVLDRSGSFYVYEMTYKSSGSLDAKLVTRVSFSGKFKEAPQTLAVSRSGRVFVTAKKSATVLIFR